MTNIKNTAIKYLKNNKIDNKKTMIILSGIKIIEDMIKDDPDPLCYWSKYNQY